MTFHPLVERALAVALEAHADQKRKGSGDPYVVHPLHVALLVSQWGGDATTIAAAVLHDVVEDSDEWTPGRMRVEFGDEIAALVLSLTEDKSLPWEERKEHAIASIPDLSEGACLVKAADKLHNLASLAEALTATDDPASIWARFKGGRERTIAKERRVVAALAERLGGPVAGELAAALEAVANSD